MFDRDQNAREIVAAHIDKDPVGRRLTHEARQQAINFAADSWKGRLTVRDASQIGIRHVTQGVFKSTK